MGQFHRGFPHEVGPFQGLSVWNAWIDRKEFYGWATGQSSKVDIFPESEGRIYPLVHIQKTIENDHRNSGSTQLYSMVDLSMVFC